MAAISATNSVSSLISTEPLPSLVSLEKNLLAIANKHDARAYDSAVRFAPIRWVIMHVGSILFLHGMHQLHEERNCPDNFYSLIETQNGECFTLDYIFIPLLTMAKGFSLFAALHAACFDWWTPREKKYSQPLPHDTMDIDTFAVLSVLEYIGHHKNTLRISLEPSIEEDQRKKREYLYRSLFENFSLTEFVSVNEEFRRESHRELLRCINTPLLRDILKCEEAIQQYKNEAAIAMLPFIPVLDVTRIVATYLRAPRPAVPLQFEWNPPVLG